MSSWVKVFFGLVLVTLFSTTGQAEGTKGNNKCNSAVTGKKETEEKVTVAKIKPSDVKIELKDLFAPADKNPIVSHPALVMTAAQKYYQLFRLQKPYTVKDPVFRVRDVQVYPVFTGELISKAGMIVGQYHAVEALEAHVASLARGEQGGKLFGAIGPSGTGKTEMFNVLDGIRTILSSENPDYFEFTFKWINLDKVPALRGLTPKLGGDVGFKAIRPDIQRSPFTLLRADMQEKILDEVRFEVEKKLGFPLAAWTEIAPKEGEIVNAIMEHEYKDVAEERKHIDDLTEEEYLKALSKYVRVTPRVRGKYGSEIIRAMGPNPNFSKIFVGQNPVRSMIYSDSSPLAWDYTGKVLQQDGGALVFDEAARNEKEVLDALLEVAQNSIAEADGPATHLDVVTMIASNDESIESAAEDGDLKAFLDRTDGVPMRLNLHPNEIAKTSLLMVGVKNFRMRSLEDKNSPLEPLDLNKAYPLPDAQGHLKGINRRYALYYQPSRSSDPILISPHSLEMMAITASMTRLVVDPKVMQKFPGDFERVTPQHQYFVNPVARMNMILGKDNVGAAVRVELAKLSNLTHEGESGISARQTQTWLKRALDIAIKKDHKVVTPEVLDMAFNTLIDTGTIKVPTNALRSQWRQRYSMVKNHFTLPALHRDLQEIIAGHGERAERMYDIVMSEIIAMAEDSSANTWQPDNNSAAQPINKKRMAHIQIKYKALHGREFAPGFLMSHLAKAKKGERYPELLSAIEAYITETELDIGDAARDIVNHYNGGKVSPEIEKKVTLVENRLAEYGYDHASFKSALSFWAILNAEKVKADQAKN